MPFTYSAEVYPLQVREIGMAWATAVTWFFNFINALVFPLQLRRWTSFGAFAWFGGWNAILWVLVLCFCPETKGFVRPSLSISLSLSGAKRRRAAHELSPAPQTLEELDDVFSMSTARQARYGLESPAYWFRKYALRQKVHRVALQHYHPSEEKDKAEVQHRELA